MNVLKKSLMIAVVATALDQAYHLLMHLPHSVLTLFSFETMLYISAKFMIVAIVSNLILSEKKFAKNNYWLNAAGISIIAALAFGIVMSALFPYTYNPIIHLAHALDIFIAIIAINAMTRR